jgi:predicted SnoaL-like aldol condensation-catalyzing enzyme
MTVAGSRTIRTTGMMVAAVLTFGNISAAAAGPLEDANRKTVLAFNEMAFRDHQAKKAAELYLGDVYIQHNPYVPNGPEAFATFFSKFTKEHPTASVDVKRVVAEGDLVVVHSHFKLTPDAKGSAAVDIFRLEKGRIVEHWDVVQDVPAEPAPNGNTMFDGDNSK